jgi:hypothetical protein
MLLIQTSITIHESAKNEIQSNLPPIYALFRHSRLMILTIELIDAGIVCYE